MTTNQKQNPIPPPSASPQLRRAEAVSSERGRPTPKAHKRTVQAREAAIDAALDMTFPASDPPAW